MKSNSRCAACKHLRRRCSENCPLSPYFPASSPNRFSDAHRIFGTSNMTKTLLRTPVEQRVMAANTMCIEAGHRIEDPVYGCSKFIVQLQQQINAARMELAMVQAQIAFCRAQKEARMGLERPQNEEVACDHEFDFSPDVLEFFSFIDSL